ncbi:MAG TPA: hypothetical protein VM677_23160 [Actinokineospora sp.]|jgi:hypothetical protein|nr:hypothetical protein [Actinokineospora sp.]
MPKKDLPKDDQAPDCDHKGPYEFDSAPGQTILRCGKCYAIVRVDAG